MYEIEKNIPVPANFIEGEGQKRCKYPFAELDVGDSFYVTWRKRTRFAVSTYCRIHAPKKFICREEGTGYRVWRVL